MALGVTDVVTPDDSLRRLLQGLPREAPPPIPVEALLRRLVWRRARVGLGLLALVAGPLLALLLFPGKPEPPIHLRLRVVNVGTPTEEPSGGGPPEINLP